ncbi:MAG: branched-chain amino acid aminotransferase [Micrococcales bacterium]|nr:branched-chain amino acid aminotransferase [Micrococcales bacterium]
MGEFEIRRNPHPTPPEERAAALANPVFGTQFTDHMARVTWTSASGWHDRRVEAFAEIPLSPAAAVLHYAQEIFEGLKAYRRDDGSVWAFRAGANAARFVRSAQRMAMPELSVADFLDSLSALVSVDAAWVPSGAETSLYLRPVMFAAERFLGVRQARRYEYLVIASPVGSYFAGGVKPVSIWVEQETRRAGPGGTGSAKCGGNYAAAMLGQVRAYEHGCDQVLFLEAGGGTAIEELGGMNVFVVLDDGSVATPALTGSFLEGITRASVLALLEDRGVSVVERSVSLSELLSGAGSGQVREMFACGTAAVVTPVGRLVGEGFEVSVAGGVPGELTMSIREQLMGIQYGRIEDRWGWTTRLA